MEEWLSLEEDGFDFEYDKVLLRMANEYVITHHGSRTYPGSWSAEEFVVHDVEYDNLIAWLKVRNFTQTEEWEDGF